MRRPWGPGSELAVVEGGGHGGSELSDVTRTAIDRLADRLEPTVVPGTGRRRGD